jgi:protein-S-isoprenylcysteine O-methyltransferase Ste14
MTTKLQKLRVPLGFAFGLVFLIAARPAPPYLYPGLAVALAGLSFRIWASGHLVKSRELTTGGPYRFTRNPLYFGSFLMGTGFCMAAAQPVLLALFLILFPSIYIPVIKREEQEMLSAFGASFASYRESVPLFFPFSVTGKSFRTGQLPPGKGNFLWKRVILNREYKAVAGFVGLTLYMVFRSL